MRIVVQGTGYVGSVVATCFAWLGHEVTGLDPDGDRVRMLDRGQPPLYEPGLAELLAATLPTGRLRFTRDPAGAIPGSRVAFLCVGTPPRSDELPDLSQVRAAAADLARHMDEGLVVVNKSTVPVGGGNLVRALIEERSRVRFSVVSNPEFLREGRAVADFLHPDRVVLGAEDGGSARVLEAYRPILAQGFPGGHGERRPRLFLTSLASAEMVKYAANAFLATKVSFANEIATLCELMGADSREVLPAIGADRRIGSDFLEPGLGWGGSCLPKDVAALSAMGATQGHSPSLLRAVEEVNAAQVARIVGKLQTGLGVLTGKHIALLGLTFKPGTDDVRASPALGLASALARAGALVTGYDPALKDLRAAVRLAPDPYEAADRADAVVVATAWAEFARLDLGVLAERMRGRLLLDARNVVPVDEATAVGLHLVGVGW